MTKEIQLKAAKADGRQYCSKCPFKSNCNPDLCSYIFRKGYYKGYEQSKRDLK